MNIAKKLSTIFAREFAPKPISTPLPTLSLPISERLSKLLSQINKCTDYQCIYALEESFNENGLTIQSTSKNRMVLCKLRNNKPVAENVVEDYIFIGGLDNPSKELSDRVVSKICEFVKANAGDPGKVKNEARPWRNGLRMCNSIMIANEDVQEIAGDILLEQVE